MGGCRTEMTEIGLTIEDASANKVIVKVVAKCVQLGSIYVHSP